MLFDPPYFVLKSLSVSLRRPTHCPTAFHDLRSASLLFPWVTRNRDSGMKSGQADLRDNYLPHWIFQCGKVVVVETVPGVLHRVLVAVFGWYTRGFGGLVVGSNIHLTGCCGECWKSIWWHEAQNWFIRDECRAGSPSSSFAEISFNMVVPDARSIDWASFFCLCRHLPIFFLTGIRYHSDSS